MNENLEIRKNLTQRRETLDYDFAEQAVQRENLEVLSALDNSHTSELEQIEHALVRMDKGEYGVCEGCGEEISPKRLEAVPYTSFCIKCAA
jgi:DnaK suppressor protein